MELKAIEDTLAVGELSRFNPSCNTSTSSPMLRLPNAGSFIRPSANIFYGRSFLKALASKYVETLHGHDSPETVVLGSSHGAIVVEAVSLDKIRGKLANLARLREVSLDDEYVATCDPPGALQNTCPSESYVCYCSVSLLIVIME